MVIWLTTGTGASEMIIDFIQKYQQYQIGTRTPILDVPDLNYRSYGYLGLRFSWIWERFRWTTMSTDENGVPGGPDDTGIYSNIVSNRMYGPYFACGNEWYIGNNFSANIDIGGALFLDVVKERAEYSLDDKLAGGYVKRSRTTYTIAPEVTAVVGISWFPIENVQFKLGYDLLAFFNTVAAPHPVSFDRSARLDQSGENILDSSRALTRPSRSTFEMASKMMSSPAKGRSSRSERRQ